MKLYKIKKNLYGDELLERATDGIQTSLVKAQFAKSVTVLCYQVHLTWHTQTIRSAAAAESVMPRPTQVQCPAQLKCNAPPPSSVNPAPLKCNVPPH